jgi:hypothetical protein
MGATGPLTPPPAAMATAFSGANDTPVDIKNKGTKNNLIAFDMCDLGEERVE